jgi:hypothetical protein
MLYIYIWLGVNQDFFNPIRKINMNTRYVGNSVNNIYLFINTFYFK